jgi:hypothetical protein
MAELIGDQIKGANANGEVFLNPGDMVRFTYSSAPTFKRMSAS